MMQLWVAYLYHMMKSVVLLHAVVVSAAPMQMK